MSGDKTQPITFPNPKDEPVSKPEFPSPKEEPVSKPEGTVPLLQLLPNVFPSCLACTADYIGLGCIMTVLPFWLDVHKLDEWLGIIVSIQYAGVILGSILMGVFGDKLGHKVTVVVALAGDTIFFSLSAVAIWLVSIPMLLVVRTFAGFFTPLSPSITFMVDRLQLLPGDPNRNRTKAVLIWSTCAPIGYMTGALIGGLCGPKHFGTIALITGGIALVATMVAVVARSYHPPSELTSVKAICEDSAKPQEGEENATKPDVPKEALQKQEEGNMLKRIWSSLICKPQYLSTLLSQFVCGLCFTGYVTVMGVIVKDFGWTSQDLAALNLVTVGLLLSTNLVMSKVLDMDPPHQLSAFVYLVSVPILVALCFLDHLPIAFSIIICVVFIPVAVGIPTGSLLSVLDALLFAPTLKGSAVGIARGAFNVGQMIGSVWILFLRETLHPLPWSFLASLNICAGLAFLIFRPGARKVFFLKPFLCASPSS